MIFCRYVWLYMYICKFKWREIQIDSAVVFPKWSLRSWNPLPFWPSPLCQASCKADRIYGPVTKYIQIRFCFQRVYQRWKTNELVQKYTACLGNSKERFQLLKEFLIDENLLDTEVIYMDVWFHTDTNGGKVIYGWFILIIFSESKVWGRGGGLLCQVKPLFLILQCRYLGPAK